MDSVPIASSIQKSVEDLQCDHSRKDVVLEESQQQRALLEFLQEYFLDLNRLDHHFPFPADRERSVRACSYLYSIHNNNGPLIYRHLNIRSAIRLAS